MVSEWNKALRKWHESLGALKVYKRDGVETVSIDYTIEVVEKGIKALEIIEEVDRINKRR